LSAFVPFQDACGNVLTRKDTKEVAHAAMRTIHALRDVTFVAKKEGRKCIHAQPGQLGMVNSINAESTRTPVENFAH